ncbi:Phosphoglycolate phosphatase, HAD superfamily [Prauserella flava]|nr:Phosphoglycolate phosphatase, HAD superfamily [Prauserella flava]MCR3735791.1 Phosphoglycolate phosphatase, HAD superfamily [Prauserella salsuginis]
MSTLVEKRSDTVCRVTLSQPDHLVLWDIDLTLVDLSGSGGDWYRKALATVAGITLERMPPFPGRTELAITTELLTAHGVEPTPDLVNRLWQELTALATDPADDLRARGTVLPGVTDVLTRLTGTDGVVQSLVTGNLPAIARHKLSAFGLHPHLDFEIGGYGSLSAHRPELVAKAVELAAAKHGRAPKQVVVIGDTPNDVAAALACDAVAVAVATGRHDMDALRVSGAHAVLPDLGDTDAALAAILG